MRNIIVICFAILFSVTNNLHVTAQSKTMDEFTVQVDGLGCPFCAYGLEKKFKELKGIKKVKIEMETGMMNFLYPMDKVLSIEQVEKQVEKAGYTPVSVAVKRTDGTVETTPVAETAVAADGEVETTTFFVSGNCGMCKARIEKAAKGVNGVQNAVWDKKTRELTVTFVGDTSQSSIEQAIAVSGHDTKTAKADKETYENLPGCCQYERL